MEDGDKTNVDTDFTERPLTEEIDTAGDPGSGGEKRQTDPEETVTDPDSTGHGEDSAVLKQRQTSTLCKVTRKRNEISRSMLNQENLPDVKAQLADYDELFLAYQDAHTLLLMSLGSEEASLREIQLYSGHEIEIRRFRGGVTTWIAETEDRLSGELYSASQLGSSKHRKSKGSSRSGSYASSSSSASLKLAKEMADLAALQAERKMIKQKQELESKKQELKAAEERLQLDLKISQTAARSKVYTETLAGEIGLIDSSSMTVTQSEKDKDTSVNAKDGSHYGIHDTENVDHMHVSVKPEIVDHVDINPENIVHATARSENTGNTGNVNVDTDYTNVTHDTVGDIGVKADTLGHTIGTESKCDNVGQYVGVSRKDSGGAVPNVQRSRNVSPNVSHVHNRFNHVYANTVVHGDVDNSSNSNVDTIEHDFTVPASQPAVARQSVHQATFQGRSSYASVKPCNPDAANRQGASSPRTQGVPEVSTQMSQEYPTAPSPAITVGSTVNPGAGAFQQPPTLNVAAPAFESSSISEPSIRDLVTAVTLPQPDVPKFSGNPVEYHTFMMAFDTRISTRTSSNTDRLYYLNQYLLGEAKDAISGCLHMNPTVGYPEARRILDQEFGDSYKISSAYLNQIMSWTLIKHDDTVNLRRFAVFLRKCYYAMQGIQDLTILNHLPNLQTIVSKLPSFLQGKWRDQVSRIKMQEHRSPIFLDLTLFVEAASETANDPVFGKVALDKLAPGKSSTKTVRPSTVSKQGFTVSVNQTRSSDPTALSTKQRCLLCDEAHHLDDCDIFRKKGLDERRDFIKSKRACFGCLEPNHRSNGCLNKITCKVCNKKHPTSLHMENFQPSHRLTEFGARESVSPSPTASDRGSEASVENNPEKQNVQTYTCNVPEDDVFTVLQPIIPVRVSCDNGNTDIITYAFLDNGSNGCFLTNDLLSQLGATGQDTTLKMKTMSGVSYTPAKVVKGLTVSSYSGEFPTQLPKCFTRDHISVDVSQIPHADVLSCWHHLEEAKNEMPPFLTDVPVGLLIGSNCPKVLQPLKVIPSSGNGPFAVKHLHGWTISGPVWVSKSDEGVCTTHCNRINVQEIKVKEVVSPDDMLRLFDAEFSNSQASDVPGKLGHSREDVLFMEKADSKKKHIDGHFVLPLPFRDPDVVLPSNRDQVIKRANWQRKKMLTNDTYRQDYTAFVESLLQKGYARQLPSDELAADEGKVWYLPHHGVYHPTKRKLRVVFDCSAKFHGSSLNDQLLQGPDLTNSLLGVLTRFRLERVAFIGDIDAMFHQVRVIREHQNFLRFLWWPQGDLDASLQEYAMTVHLFGATSSPSIANYAMRSTAAMAEEKDYHEAANTIRKHFYVDDCLKSLPTETETINHIASLKDACSLGGFKIGKFCSNSSKVLGSIAQEDRSTELHAHSLDHQELPIERALGVFWDVNQDIFSYSINMKQKPLTRRGLLSMTASVYDPLGFVSPYLLRAKHILRELCANKQLDWDDPIPTNFAAEWRDWVNDLPALEEVKIERCFKPPHFGSVVASEIHVFSDASLVGYGAVAYLRQIDNNNAIHCSLLMAKSRLAPLKQTTIPRLELTAATTAVRISCLLRHELGIPVNKIVYYTDATTVLHYIANQKRKFPIFVANRVQFILDYSSISDWHYIDSKSNPADYASRGMNAKDITQNPEWINGPDFLWHSQTTCPLPSPSKDYMSSEELSSCATTAVNTESDTTPTDKLIDYFSDWYKLKLAVAVYHKVCCILHDRKYKCTTDYRMSVQGLESAEHSILRYIQSQHFTNEIDCLKHHTRLPKGSHILKLDPYMEQGLLRVGGRLSKSHLQESTKHPVILPKDSHVTHLIIQETHNKLAHAGRNHVLAKLRETYWVIHGNATVRKMIAKCVTCRRLRMPVSGQKMADLPPERCSDAPPFTYTGVDLFGPFVVKQGRKEHKRYGVLFTCLACRAVHIEVTASLDTDSFLLALRRFVARRGPVVQIRCDNGTNFVGAERELRDALAEMQRKDIHQQLLKRHIEWVFNPPAASHFGGIWERQIRTVRKVLSRLSREFGGMMDDESFCTLMCEIEAIVNSRPITTPSADSKDSSCLTPAHILHMKCGITLPPPGIFQRADVYLRKRWRRVQYVANIFWTRWKKEYLLTLQERSKWNHPRRNMAVGDVVIIREDASPRNTWPTGRVTEIEPDRKGLVRAITVKTATSTLRRPVDKLVLLIPVEEQV